MPRIVVTGMGVVSPIGQTADSFFESLITARSGIRLVTPALYSGANTLVAASIDFDPALYWPPHIASQYDRTTQFALVAAGQAFADAALDLTTEAGDARDDPARRSPCRWPRAPRLPFPAIRTGQARLRFIMNAHHTAEQIDAVVESLARALGRA